MNRNIAEAFRVLNDCKLFATAAYACAERDVDAFGEELFECIFSVLLDVDVSEMLPLAKSICTKFDEQGGVVELPAGTSYDMPLTVFIDLLTKLACYVNLYASEQEEVLLRTFVFTAVLDSKLHWDIRTISVRISAEVQNVLSGLEDKYAAGHAQLLEEFAEICDESGLDLTPPEDADDPALGE